MSRRVRMIVAVIGCGAMVTVSITGPGWPKWLEVLVTVALAVVGVTAIYEGDE